ncbi:hypothetical protein [Kitasatospora sp. NPDC059673]|uniref:hypothetical protein n=1 Tax=Kitasatospora sp. NPDC059673 TaxID=3346901 RepID=UPI0036B474D8
MSTAPGRESRRHRLLAILTTSALLTTPLIATGIAAADTGTATAAPAPSPEARASAEAKKTGKTVEVTELLDEFTETLANPDGTFTRRSHVEPVRAKVGGTWRTPDATLARAGDGRVAPVAPTFPITFSGGGTTPLATMTRDGHTMSVGWPTALPAPTLSGNTALYPEVLPGVDLKVLANVDGFAEHLIVKTRQAAANPALAELRLLTETDGLSLENAEDGGIKAKAKDGSTVFQAPAPTMWDTPTSAEPTKAAARGGQEPAALPVKSARLGVKLGQGEIRLTPDRGLLTAADAQFPLVIDPVFTGGSRQKWSFTASSYPNSAFVSGSGWTSNNPTDEFRVGYSGDSKHQSFFTIDTNGLGGAQILTATLQTVETHSWGCSASDAGNTELWVVGGWDHDPTWNNPLPRINKVAADSFAGGNPDYCPDDLGHDFVSDGLKAAVQQMADWNASSLTLSLAAESGKEGSTSSYKRFRNNPHLEITYNRTPVVNEYGAFEGTWSPGGAGNKPVACERDPAKPAVIGNNDLTLTARVSDPDGTSTNAYYRVWKEGWSWYHDQDETVGNGSWSSRSWPTSEFEENTLYRWGIAARDGITQSGYVPGDPYCAFKVDRTAPTAPIVTPADGVPLSTPLTARKPRTLTLTSSDANFAGFCWILNRPLSTSNTRCQQGTWVDAPSGTATITVLQTQWPSNELHVAAYDKAGNRSTVDGTDNPGGGANWIIKTAPPEFVREAGTTGDWNVLTEAEHDVPGDMDGDGYADLATVYANGDLWIYPGNGAGGFGTRTFGVNNLAGALITHRGDFIGAASLTAGADGYEDMIARESSGRMFIYGGDGAGHLRYEAKFQLVHPTKADWSAATQILAPGNIDGKPGNDLLVTEDGKLWLYSGKVLADGRTPNHTAPLDLAGGRVISAGVPWNMYTAGAPGDLTGDGTPDILAKDNRDGTVWLFPGQVTAGTYGLAAPQRWGTGDLQQRPQFAVAGNTAGTVTTVAAFKDANDNGVEDPGEGYTYRRFTPNATQATAFWAGTPADSAAVTYRDTAGADKSTTCPTGCTLFYTGNASGFTTPPRLAQTSAVDRQLFESASNGPLPATVTGALRSASEAVLTPGTTLKPGASVASGRIRLTMQTDGNLVLYYLFDGKPIWNTGTAGHPGATATMQADGNLVITDANGTTLNSSQTSGNNGAYAKVQNDCNFVVYNTAGTAIWSSNTYNPTAL